jgi:hypothetical protein
MYHVRLRNSFVVGHYSKQYTGVEQTIQDKYLFGFLKDFHYHKLELAVIQHTYLVKTNKVIENSNSPIRYIAGDSEK